MKDITLEGFNEDQQNVLLNLYKNMEESVVDKVREAVSEDKDANDDLELDPDRKELQKDNQRLDKMTRIWKNNGYLNGAKERVTVQQLLEKDAEISKVMRDNFSSDHPLLIPRVVSNMAREAIEPQLVLTPLMSRINFSAGTRITFPAWGAIHAADLAEGEEYPERGLELAGQVEATIGKSGVAIKVTEEMMRYSQFDVMSLHIRAAGRALARLKEKKVANLITSNGVTIIDNQGGLGTKSSTGRDAAGNYNGGLTLDDLFYAWAQMVDTGFTPNTLIMHPFAWQIFAEESIARAFGFVNGVNSLMWQLAQGSPGNANPWRVGDLNQNTYVSSPENIASTFTNVPSIFPTNFRIIVSPFMPYSASTSRTDIVFCDVNELGILVVDEDVTTDQWDDPARDIRKMKFRERYGLAIMNDGKGVGLLKNIKIVKSVDLVDRISVELTGLTLTGDATYTGNVG
ncbi:MAG: phage major capsid protein [Candidatus Thorarchaeota archaeon]|jgi:HK97 family phage major capsid protein